MKIEEQKIEEYKHLTLTEQLLFLIESVTELKGSKEFKGKKDDAIVASCLADLQLLNKLEIKNEEIRIIDDQALKIDYLNKFRETLANDHNTKKVTDVITTLKPKSEQLEKMIRKTLIEKEFLIEEKGFLHHNKVHTGDNVLLRRNNSSLELALRPNSNPTKGMLYTLAILDAIHLLPSYFKSNDEYKLADERLIELMDHDSDVKVIYKSLIEQPEVKKHLSQEQEKFIASVRTMP